MALNCKAGRHENQWTVNHRMTKTPEYSTWQSMRSRCEKTSDKDFIRYGGRGIKVCTEWANSFEAFYLDMGPRPKNTSIDRRDNNGPYCKDNCYWATATEQTRNRSIAINLTYAGITKPLQVWCDEYSAKYSTVHSRIFKHGWPLELALFAPNGWRKNFWKKIAWVSDDFPHKETA